ncbi:hypothetical protein UACE39S_04442 [Ureibacillus acetophenoni]
MPKEYLPVTPSRSTVKVSNFTSGGMKGCQQCLKLIVSKDYRNEKGLSISAVATAMKVNWRTAKKYGDGEQLPQEKLYIKKGMMYEEKWGEIVSDWLEEDLKVKKKLRRTNKKMYEDLQSMGFKGSYPTVCNYIQEWRSAEDDELSKGHERLDHPEGEAQLDFGTMEAVQDGEIVDVHALVMFPSK